MSSLFTASPLHLLLLRRLEEHNRHVLGYTLLTAAGAILLWLAAYGTAWWITLFLLTAVRGDEAAPPAHFTRLFCAAAAASLALAALHRWMVPDARPRDRKGGGEIAFDFLMAIPRVTLAIQGNFSAWQKLSPDETEQAVLLLERLQAGRRLLHTLPQEISDEKLRNRLLYTLQLIGLVEIRREDQEHWLKFLVPTAEPQISQSA